MAIQKDKSEQMFLLLVSCNEEAKKDLGKIADLIQKIDKQYMSLYGSVSRTIPFASVALIGPYDFAVLFTGTNESALYLASQISQKGMGMYETLTMPAVDMETFIGMAKSSFKRK